MNALTGERVLLMDVAWQGTSLLALGLLLSLLLGHRPARAHAALAGAVAGCLLAPWLTLGVREAGWGLLKPPQAPQLPVAMTPQIPERLPSAVGFEGGEIDDGASDAGHAAGARPERSEGFGTPAPGPSILAWVGMAWCVGSIALLLRLVLGAAAARRLVAAADAELPEGAQSAMGRAAARVGLRPAPALCASDRVGSPVIWCWRRPVVVVPGRAACAEPPGGWEGVLCHELAHLRRHDHVTSLLAELAICVMPWNPLAWAARRRLTKLSERACDEWALASGSPAESYAESLLAFVPRARPALAQAAVTSRADLPARVRRILSPSLRPAPRLGAGRAAAIGLVCTAAVAGLALAQAGPSPQPLAPSDALAAVASQPAPDRSDLAARLADLDALDPKAAEPLLREFGALDPAASFEVLEQVWGRIRDPRIKQRLAGRALHVGDGKARSYSPRALDVLHLAATDPSIPVQNWALGRLREVAVQEFAHDYQAYLEWHERNAGRPVQEVIAAGVRGYTEGLAALEGEALDEHVDRLRTVRQTLDALPVEERAAAYEEFARIAERWLGAPEGVERPLRDLLGTLARARLSDEYLRRVIVPAMNPDRPGMVRTAAIRLLGEQRAAWAVDPLLKLLAGSLSSRDYARQLMASAGEALAEIGDPRAIPTMIAVIEADAPAGREPGDTAIYWVGYFGLSRMTGVEYKGTHDGAWWRRWWDENRHKYPAASDLEIPSIGRGVAARSEDPTPASLWMLVIAATALAAQPADAAEAPDPALVRAWADKLAGLGEAERGARRAAIQELVTLDTDAAMTALRESWREIDDPDVKQELVGAFYRGGGREARAEHPRLLDVLHLAMNDRSEEVRESAVHLLRMAAFLDFSVRAGEYAAWHERNRERPVADVRREGLEALIERLRTGDAHAVAADAEVLAWLGNALQDRPELDGPQLRAALLEVYERLVSDPALTVSLQGNAVSLVERLDPPEAYVRRVLMPAIARRDLPAATRGSLAHLLGDPANGWAVGFLIEQLAAVPLKDPDAALLMFGLARSLAEIGDPRAIPTMIAVIEADAPAGREPGDTAIYWVGYYGLSHLTGVSYHGSHDGAWWRSWWERNKIRYPESIRAMDIPTIDPPVAEGGPAAAFEAGFPVQDIRIGDDEQKRYFLIGPRGEAPADGYALLVVLPGGDGSAEFRPFVASMLRNALPEGFVVAQAVAPVWTDDEDRIVWPTARLPDPKMAFPTERFIAGIVADVTGRHAVDASRVYALGWSSGGPPVYAATLMEGSPLAGAFVAMSVYKPDVLPPLAGAARKAFYILHSPQDFIAMRFPEAAAAELARHGAATKLETYAGGHGWRGDVFGNIRRGIEWLEAQRKQGE